MVLIYSEKLSHRFKIVFEDTNSKTHM